MKFTIIEFDNDYRTVSGHEEKDFASLSEAEAYAKAQSWDGYTYLVDTSL